MRDVGDVVVAMSGIVKSYGAVNVLKGVDFSVRAGRTSALIGENGAGKSTLLKIISGEIDDWTGNYRLRGAPVRFSSIRAAQKAGIALIHQETISLPTLTVAENVLAGRLPRRGPFLDRRVLHEQAEAALARLGVSLDLDRPASRLNTAELQLLDIARALLGEPSVLLLDEPTASLPAEGRDRLFNVMERLREQGTALVLISHHLDEIFEHCDDVTVLRDGRVVQQVSVVDSSPARAAEAMIGRELNDTDAAPRGHATAGDSMLAVEGLTDGSSLHDIGFEVRAGEILGVSGLLGAGQAELIGALIGRRQAQGTMTVDGQPWQPKSVSDAVRGGMGIVSEDRKVDGLVLDASITANIGLASTILSPFKVYRPVNERAAANDLIRHLDIKPPSPTTEVMRLSGGNQQKVTFAKWLRRPLKVMILHEPTRGVDVGAKALLHRQIRLLAEAGTAVLLVSCDLPEVIALADRHIVLHRGTIAGRFEREATQHDLLMAAFSARSQGGERDD